MSPSSSTTALSNASTTHLPFLTPSSTASTAATSNSPPRPNTSAFQSPLTLAHERFQLQCPDATNSVPNLCVPSRPSFNASLTNDRLREGYGAIDTCKLQPRRMESRIQKGRQSIFKELDLDDPSPISPSLGPCQIPEGSISPTQCFFSTLATNPKTFKKPNGAANLSIPPTNPLSAASAPTSPTFPVPKRGFSMRTIGTRAISFNLPPRSGTSLESSDEPGQGARPGYRRVSGDRTPPGTEGDASSVKTRRRWWSRPKLKTTNSAPPPTLRNFISGSPTKALLK